MARHPGGRPAKFDTPEQMQEAVDAYFDECDNHKATVWKNGRLAKVSAPEPYTMTALAMALGFESRRSLADYNKKNKFSPTIKKARMRVEVSVEKRMLTSNGVVAGVIFNAKNNFGWVDKTEIDQTVRQAKPLLGGKVSLPKQSDVDLSELDEPES